jgi:hypothetical protein
MIPVIFAVLFFCTAVGFGIASYKCKSDGFFVLTVVFLIAHFILLGASISNAEKNESNVLKKEK